jgi:hypothetical protein
MTEAMPWPRKTRPEALRATARQNLGLYTTFPFFQPLFRASGFATEVAQAVISEGNG